MTTLSVVAHRSWHNLGSLERIPLGEGPGLDRGRAGLDGGRRACRFSHRREREPPLERAGERRHLHGLR